MTLTLVSCTQVGNSAEAPDLGPVVIAVCRVNKKVEDVDFSFSLFLCISAFQMYTFFKNTKIFSDFAHKTYHSPDRPVTKHMLVCLADTR